jgi:hypothetical protein
MQQDTVFLKNFLSGEIREVASPSEELSRLMAQGWHQTLDKSAPPVASRVVEEEGK